MTARKSKLPVLTPPESSAARTESADRGVEIVPDGTAMLVKSKRTIGSA
jgi:hypothetical protein